MADITKILDTEELIKIAQKWPFPWPEDPIPPWLNLERDVLIDIFKAQT